MMPRTLPTDRLATITPADVRRLLAEIAVQVVRGEIATKEAGRIARNCRRVTRELNQRNQRFALAAAPTRARSRTYYAMRASCLTSSTRKLPMGRRRPWPTLGQCSLSFAAASHL